MEKVDQLDLKILKIISVNARIPFKDVAAVCGVHALLFTNAFSALLKLGSLQALATTFARKALAIALVLMSV